jgi:hypothetical protein
MEQQFVKHTKEDIAKALKVDKAWAEKYLSTLVGHLTRNPGHYRSFGPYWWLVKRALIESGNLEMGEEYDADVADALDYGDTPTNLAAAFLYQDQQESMGALFETQHIMDGVGDSIDYWIDDSDMELRYAASRMEI